MRLGTLFIALLGLGVAGPALAQPVIVAGAAPAQEPECVLARAGATGAEIRCRLRPAAGGPGSEVTFVVSAGTTPAVSRCAGADVVQLPGAAKSHSARPLIVQAASKGPCGA